MAAATIHFFVYLTVAAAMVWHIACGRRRSETFFPGLLLVDYNICIEEAGIQLLIMMN